MPVSANLPSSVQARRDDGGLDRVEHVEAGRELAESVPVRRSALSIQSSRVPMPSSAQLLRAPDLEPPVLAPFVVDLAHRAAEVERLERCYSSTSAVPPGGFHHRGGDVAGGDDRVLRRGRRVHQVRFVEDVAVELAASPSPARGSARPARCPPAACGSSASRRSSTSLRRGRSLPIACMSLVELVERRVRQPGFVEVQGVDLRRRASASASRRCRSMPS